VAATVKVVFLPRATELPPDVSVTLPPLTSSIELLGTVMELLPTLITRFDPLTAVVTCALFGTVRLLLPKDNVAAPLELSDVLLATVTLPVEDTRLRLPPLTPTLVLPDIVSELPPDVRTIFPPLTVPVTVALLAMVSVLVPTESVTLPPVAVAVSWLLSAKVKLLRPAFNVTSPVAVKLELFETESVPLPETSVRLPPLLVSAALSESWRVPPGVVKVITPLLAVAVTLKCVVSVMLGSDCGVTVNVYELVSACDDVGTGKPLKDDTSSGNMPNPPLVPAGANWLEL